MREGTIASLTPTVCRLLRVDPPALSDEPPLAAIETAARETWGEEAAERCLIFCPDAVGDHLWSRFPDQAAAVAEIYPRRVPVSSVVPSVTPVCFASVFTGASPVKHGIRKPERPVLTCDTLFDALLRAGKRVAISAVRGSSIDLIFRNRALDYFSENYDTQAAERALGLLEADGHDVIVVYHQAYDDLLHKTGPFSPPGLEAFRAHVASARHLARAAGEAWRNHRHVVIVAPDHGGHADGEGGGHGLDIPEDMEVSHWYRVQAGAS